MQRLISGDHGTGLNCLFPFFVVSNLPEYFLITLYKSVYTHSYQMDLLWSYDKENLHEVKQIITLSHLHILSRHLSFNGIMKEAISSQKMTNPFAFST